MGWQKTGLRSLVCLYSGKNKKSHMYLMSRLPFFFMFGRRTILEKCACGVSNLLKRQIAKHSHQSSESRYSPALRSFALTFHLYSPHAHRYVRKMFDTCLPHPRTISKWYQQVDGQPGFTNLSFSDLKIKADATQKMG